MGGHIFKIFSASIGVLTSDKIPQLTGRTLYVPSEAMARTSSRLGLNFMGQTSLQTEMLLRLFRPRSIKKSLTEEVLCQGRIIAYPRCHLDSQL